MNERDPIPFGQPYLGPEEAQAVAGVLASPQLVHGPTAAELERRFAERVGTRHAISVSSCTAGLHLMLRAAGIGPGDHVIVPAMTHVATAHAVEYCNATPVFVDIDPATGNMDTAATVSAIRDGARAVLVVHYLGLPVDMEPILQASETYGAVVFEDSALALDATLGDRKTGALALAGAFSFYPTKHMTTAEGGMVTTDDDDLAADIRRRKAFGYDKALGERSRPGIYDVDMLGFNYRMSELHAALGLAQLDRLDEFQRRRADNFRRLAKGLADCEALTVFPARQGTATSSHYCLNAVLPIDGSISRDAVVSELRSEGIGTSVHYPQAVPLFSFYRNKYGHKPGDFHFAEWVAAQAISLPVGPHLGPDDPERIAQAVLKAVRTHSPA